ncbi:MAG: subclass B3 metallo-beta-lactamase [Pirellulales bacterium]
MPTLDQLIFVGLNGYAVALDRDSGEIVWSNNELKSGYVTLLLDGDRLIVSTNGYIFCLDPLTGRILWQNLMRGYGAVRRRRCSPCAAKVRRRSSNKRPPRPPPITPRPTITDRDLATNAPSRRLMRASPTFSLLFLAFTSATFAQTPNAAPTTPGAQTALEQKKLADDPAYFLKSAAKSLGWNEPAEPAKIVGPIHFVGTKGLGVYLIAGSDGHILINTGMEPSGRLIVESIKKLGFNPTDVKLLLIGHAHVDHCGAAAIVQKATGAQIALMEAEVALLESGGKTDFHYGDVPEFRFAPVKVDRVLRDGEQIKLGDIALTALHTPGHTRGSTTFVMNVVDGGRTFTVVFPNGTSVNPGYRVTNAPSYPGIADDLRRTLHTLEMLKPDVWLDPHTDQFAYEQKLARAAQEGSAAWIDPHGYRRWVAAKRVKLEAAIEREIRE